MSFTRTSSGLSNLCLFYDVDFVFFVEGGEKSFTFDEIEDEKFNDLSIDIKFWSTVVEKHEFNKKVEYRGVGSKDTAKKICEKIENGNVKNIIVAMDSDLDGFFGEKFSSPYILYTKGYSWECDVYCPELVKEQIKSYVNIHIPPDEIDNVVESCYEKLNRLARRLIVSEILFRQSGIQLISTCTGDRFVAKLPFPKLKLDQIRQVISEKKDELPRPAKIYCCSIGSLSWMQIYGKLIESYALAIIYYFCRKLTKIKNLPKDIVRASMIERYGNSSETDSQNHYKEQIEALKAA